MKGITPVIATILLLLITVSIVGIGFVFFSNVTQKATEGVETQSSQQLQQAGTTFSIDSINNNVVYVRNTGFAPVNLTFYVNGTEIDANGSTVQPGSVVAFTLDPSQLASFYGTNRMTVTGGGSFSLQQTVYFTPPPPDITPPSTVTGLTATAVSSSQINLAWNAASDNIGVTGYRIYRCQGTGCTPSAIIATSASTSYSNFNVSSNSTYRYTAAAYDAAGNNGNQSAAATAATPQLPPAVPVVWTLPIRVTITGNNITKTGGAVSWDAGAVSMQTFGSGDGYVEFSATSNTSNVMAGLSHGNTDTSHPDIDFAIYANSNQYAYVYESGTSRGGLSTYKPGDIFRVAVEGGTVKYYKNGVNFYNSSVAPTYPLLLDTALYTPGVGITDAVVSGNFAFPAVPVAWMNTVGVSVTGNNLTKTAPNGWYNAGAISTQQILSGDGYVEFTASETNTNRMLGLSNGNFNNSYDDIDFAIYTTGSGAIYVYEKGVNILSFSTYATGDVLRVAVENGAIKYYKNGVNFYNSATAPVYPLLVDTAFFALGANITNAVISGKLVPTAVPVVWMNTVGVNATGNNLTKTVSGCWGTAGAISTQQILSGDGYVEFTASENNTNRLLGLSNGNTDNNYPDIDFAIEQVSNGNIAVFENGTQRASGGTFVSGDVLRVAVENGAIKYYKNGVNFYNSVTAPVYPLLVDTAFCDIGSTINNTVITVPNPIPVVWTSPAGVAITGNNLTKTSSSGWGNSSAVSVQQLWAGDGYFELVPNETSRYAMIGLSNGDTDSTYADIDFALYLNGNTLQIYESGTPRITYGTFNASDVLRVGLVNGLVCYYRNGINFYNSTVLPKYPLLIDSSLYNQGMVVTNSVVSSNFV